MLLLCFVLGQQEVIRTNLFLILLKRKRYISTCAAWQHGQLYSLLLNWKLLPAKLATLHSHVNGAIALSMVENCSLTSESLLTPCSIKMKRCCSASRCLAHRFLSKSSKKVRMGPKKNQEKNQEKAEGEKRGKLCLTDWKLPHIYAHIDEVYEE